MPARRYRVFGRVQGVCFRAETREAARRAGVCGWVRNLPDGSVEVHAQGPEAALRALEEFLRIGPPAARVQELRRETAAEEETAGFVIRFDGG